MTGAEFSVLAGRVVQVSAMIESRLLIWAASEAEESAIRVAAPWR